MMVEAKRTWREEKEGEWETPRGPNYKMRAESEELVKSAERELMGSDIVMKTLYEIPWTG